jgi:hypothetical protein
MEEENKLQVESLAEPPKKHKLFDRLGKYDKFKEKQYDGEDNSLLYDDLDAFLEEQEGSMQNAVKAKEELAEIFRQYPDVYEFVQAIVDAPEELSDDEKLAFALNTIFTQDEIQEIFNSDKEIIKGIRDKKSTAFALQQEIEKNLEGFQPVLDAFAMENKIPDDKKESFLVFLETEIPNMIAARFTPELLKRLYQAFTYEEKIGEITEDNAIQAKNQEKQKETKTLMPSVDSAQPSKGKSSFNLLDEVIKLNKRK